MKERSSTVPMNAGANPERPAPASFPTTRWSLIVEAGTPESPQARAALEELCSVYWYPLYAFIRRKGNAPDRAHDLTQDFFARLLEKDLLNSVDRRKGRFRAFLQVACKNFLIDAWRQDREVSATAIPIDVQTAEGRYVIEPVDDMTPERLFDRAWAFTLLDRVLGLLADEYAEPRRAELFDQLKVVLTEGKGAVRAAEVAARLGTSESAVHTACHRLRKRYREILQEQIAATLEDPSELEDEIRSLFDALGTGSADR
jgi:RNA polymerase sigma factor (sigma-70 family)